LSNSAIEATSAFLHWSSRQLIKETTAAGIIADYHISEILPVTFLRINQILPMKNYLKYSALVISIFTMASCVEAKQQTETRQLAHFTTVHSGGSWEVILEEGNSEEVRIEVKGVELSKVKTEVSGGELTLGLEKGNYNNIDLKFYVTYKTLEGLKVSGSGEIEVMDNVIARDFSISLSGSGDVEMKNLMADRLKVSISGSADIEIRGGEIGDAEISQSGSGDFDAKDLAINNLNVSKSGSGDTQVGDLGMVSVKSSGSGDIIYSGTPKMGDIRVSGSSNIRKR
jgi:hypothetical protein